MNMTDSMFRALFLSMIVATTANAGEWVMCASEGQVCSFSDTRTVRYGTSGKYSEKNLSNGTACTNLVFGDPAPGIKKACHYYQLSWTMCASENSYCSFSGNREVRYGASGKYITRTFSDGTACNNSAFGDPLPGIPKSCYVLQ